MPSLLLEAQVEYSWPHFYTQRGHIADSGTGWTEWFAPQYVRRPTGVNADLKLAIESSVFQSFGDSVLRSSIQLGA